MSYTQKLLIVDDEALNREIIASYLEFGGYVVTQAENGKDALEILNKEKFDLILLDVQMPIMNGFETISEIKKNPELKDIPVIFLTSLDMPNLHIKGLEEGATHYLTKPINKAVLLATIKSVLRLSDSVNSNQSQDTSYSVALEDFSLAELLQSMDVNSKTAKIILEEMDALICVEDGKVVFVRQGEFEGIRAFERIMFLHEGTFRTVFNESCDERDSSYSIMYLLMETARESDERSLLLKDLPHLNSKVTFKRDAIEKYPYLKNLNKALSLKEVLVKMNGSLNDNVNLIIDLNIAEQIVFESEG